MYQEYIFRANIHNEDEVNEVLKNIGQKLNIDQSNKEILFVL